MKPIEIRLGQRFRFHSKIQGEHESLLYRAIHMQTNERLVLKGQQNKAIKPKKSCLSLLQEGKIYQTLQGGIGIPFMHWVGSEQDYNFIVLEQLQTSLTRLISRCDGKFSLKTAIMIAKDILTILQYFHFKNVVYNNLCPKHTLIGKGENYGKFYLIDYSKMNRYKDNNSQEHVMQPSQKTWQMRIINMQFSSYNYQIGNSATRRDDLQSLLYLVAYMIHGELPWTNQIRNMKKTQFQKCRASAQLKATEYQKLFPDNPELQTLLNYTKSLKFDQKPQYSYYLSLFDRILQKKDLIDDKMFDWIFLEEDQPQFELGHKFNIYEGEEQILDRIGKQVSPPVHEKILSGISSNKIPFAVPTTNRKNKNDKQCTVY